MLKPDRVSSTCDCVQSQVKWNGISSKKKITITRNKCNTSCFKCVCLFLVLWQWCVWGERKKKNKRCREAELERFQTWRLAHSHHECSRRGTGCSSGLNMCFFFRLVSCGKGGRGAVSVRDVRVFYILVGLPMNFPIILSRNRHVQQRPPTRRRVRLENRFKVFGFVLKQIFLFPSVSDFFFVSLRDLWAWNRRWNSIVAVRIIEWVFLRFIAISIDPVSYGLTN